MSLSLPITVKPTTERSTEYHIVQDGHTRSIWQRRLTKPTLTILWEGVSTLAAARQRLLEERAREPKAVIRILRVRQTTVSEVVQ